MSFCQNHRNHHCIHAHSCNNLNHKTMNSHNHQVCNNNNARSCKNQRNSNQLMASIPDKSKNKLHSNSKSDKRLNKILQVNEQQNCHFNQNVGGTKNNMCYNCQASQKNMQRMSKQIEQLKKQNIDINRKYATVTQQNRHYLGVIQYYRDQMDRIIKCTEQDVRNQIKRHMKQNTQLNAKNKFLLNKLSQIQQLLAKLEKDNEESQRKIHALKKQREDIAQSYTILLQRIKRNQLNQTQKQASNLNQRKKTNKMQQRYQIIIEEYNKNHENSLKQNRKLHNQIKQLTSKYEIMRQKLSNQQKLLKMQQESAMEKEGVLKRKTQAYQKQIKQLKQHVAKLQKQLKLKQQQIAFSKKVIQKQLKQMKENKELYEHIQKDDEEQNKQNRNSMGSENAAKDQINKNQYIQQLQKQVKTLRQRISVLQSQGHNKGHSSQTIQQYILTIGASQAFKKIILQKNQYIKKLIRQKGDLYQQIS